MTPHINAKKEDISDFVIMPGDPLRAEKMAKLFLTDYKLVNNVRGMYAFTGYYGDRLVTIMAHGMGCPSMGIYAHELFNVYDVEKIIRVGSMGAYSENLNLYDIVLATSSFSASTFAKIYLGKDVNLLESGSSLNRDIIDTANELGIRINSGLIHTSDVFYNDIDFNIYKNKGCLGVEMESFALFAVAQKYGKDAACLLTVSDHILTKEETSPEERQNHFTEMFKLALETSKKN